MTEQATVKRKKKVLGLGNSRAEAEQQQTPAASTVTKWSEAIGEQVQLENKHENVQYLPLPSLNLDPNNTRNLVLSLQEIKQAPKLVDVQGKYLLTDEFEQQVTDHFADDSQAEKKIDEYMKIAQLACSIGEASRMINPITVQNKGMTFNVIAGHRRVLAHYLLDEPVVLARIITSQLNDFQCVLLQWKENEDREDLSLFETLEAVRKIQNSAATQLEKSLTVRELAALLSVSKSTAGRYVKIIKAYQTDQQLRKLLLESSSITLNDVYQLCNIDDQAFKEKTYCLLANKQHSEIEEHLKKGLALAKKSKKQQRKKGADAVPANVVSRQEWALPALNQAILLKMLQSALSSSLFADFNGYEYADAAEISAAELFYLMYEYLENNPEKE